MVLDLDSIKEWLRGLDELEIALSSVDDGWLDNFIGRVLRDEEYGTPVLLRFIKRYSKNQVPVYCGPKQQYLSLKIDIVKNERRRPAIKFSDIASEYDYDVVEGEGDHEFEEVMEHIVEALGKLPLSIRQQCIDIVRYMYWSALEGRGLQAGAAEKMGCTESNISIMVNKRIKPCLQNMDVGELF